MMQLIDLFKENGCSITFATTANTTKRSEPLEGHSVEVVSIALNDSGFDDFVFQLNPSVVLFDRFVTEEKFGWRVAEKCPDALRILDTEDLHFLRNAREVAMKKGESINLYTELAKRELASILRSDLSLIISEYEMHLLIETFHIPEGILHYLPFLLDPISEEAVKAYPSFEERSGFVTIGNLLHAPNVDSVKFLKFHVWPEIRKQLPKAELSIYGHYAPEHIKQLHKPAEGFFIKGWAEDVAEIMTTSKVCLAPIRFGAGLKGKLIDAMRFGTPSVTTQVGAEGINGTLPYAGYISDEVHEMVSNAVELYSNKQTWSESQENGWRIISNRFQKNPFIEEFLPLVQMLQTNLVTHRQKHFFGQILQHQSNQATKYMGKWIEAKNK